MAMDAEKAEKLRAKYDQLKQANAVLKKGLLEKQEAGGRLEQQLKEKEATLRQQMEEIDQLQFQNARQAKQVGTLSAQVEDLQKQKQQVGWSVSGLMSGKQQQEQVQKAEEEIRILREELMMKIQENEEVHMRLFEATRQHEQEAQELRDASVTVQDDLTQAKGSLEKETGRADDFERRTADLLKQVQQKDDELSRQSALTEQLRQSLQDDKKRAGDRITFLESWLKRLTPFNEAEHDVWNRLNRRARCGREARRDDEVAQQLRTGLVEASTYGSSFFKSWAKTFCGEPAEARSAARIVVHKKLSEAVEALAKFLGEEVPSLVRPFAEQAVSAGNNWKDRFRESVEHFSKLHRRWITYQCLVLVYDSTIERGHNGHPNTTDPQVGSLVDSMWGLQRSVRRLILRLRLWTLMPALTARSGSSTHFQLLQTAITRGSKDSWRPASTRILHGGRHGLRGPSPGLGQLCALQVGLALKDVSGHWEAVGRGLSKMAAGRQAAPAADSAAAVELMNALQRFSTCVGERIAAALDEAVMRSKLKMEAAPPISGAVSDATSAREPEVYLARAAARLGAAPSSIGFEESMKTLMAAKQLASARSRLSAELREQGKRMQTIINERVALQDELQTLQDSYAIVSMNFKHAQEANNVKVSAPISVVQASRQRASALPGSPGLASESPALRQHGFTVDVLSLSPTEATLGTGAPSLQSLEPWELAVRKVYEQHARNLQAQVRIADGKALDLSMGVQQNIDSMREQEEAKGQLRDEVVAKEGQLTGLRDDLAATRKNYDSQLAVLTEHICGLSKTISDKDEGLAGLQARKVLCGHCGMWNTMGKLLDSDSHGACQTCKEKILSSN
eukprot:TRINITY_DN82805_c0_g1_i1.p1 TRINITY_DN82805_c0_g1~~TRINITY_DN82805_c0_g1_i1.p1  ORF type:complete len:851 (+),score=268.03 TRINITY_DN82805_c0_g1_i1:161-2713(+)